MDTAASVSHAAAAIDPGKLTVPDRKRQDGVSIFVVVVVAVLAVAGLAAAGVLPGGWFGSDETSRGTLDVAPPADLPSLAARSPQPVLAPAADGPAVRTGAVDDRVAPLLRAPSVRRHVGVAVADLETGRVRWDNLGADLASETFTPASTLKLFTAVAALEVLGPDHRFATSVVRAPGSGTQRLVLVGGGDPLLARRLVPKPGVSSYPAPATLTDLAADTAQVLRRDGVRRVRLGYDASLFTGPAVSPDWEPSYVPDDVVSPISALWVEEDRRPGTSDRSANPARYAADAFAAALQRRGLRVEGRVTPSAGVGAPVAQVRSAPLDQLVTHTLELSDNGAAEVLLRHVALGAGRPGSFFGGVAAVRETLTDLDVPMSGVVLDDGSGLSRDDRVTLPAVLAVLELAATGADQLRSVETGLPVAGFSGSLAYRFSSPVARAGLGAVQAKTGTLSGVHGMAGTLADRDGSALAFVALADRVPVPLTLEARARLDRIAATLAACGCG